MVDKTRFESAKNGDIVVRSHPLGTELIVNGFQQSGPKMFGVWRLGVINLLSQQFRPQRILVLGLGGGSVVTVITNRWRKASIVGIDFDATMIDIAREHFGHKLTQNLELIHADAYDFIQQSLSQSESSQPSFDLTFVDCYVGASVPDNLHTKKTVEQLMKLSRVTLFNRLNTQLELPDTHAFTTMAEQDFGATYQDQEHNRIIKLGSE